MKVDKTNGYVKYNDEKHLYWDDNDERYVSVTTLIGKFEHEFDKDFWSSYKAAEKLIPEEGWKLERPRLLNTKRFNKEILSLYSIDEESFNKSKQAILDQWAEENRISCERGTKIHAGLEESMCKPEVTLEKYDIGGKFTYKKDHYKLDLEKGVYPEFLIHYKTKDGILKLAGQVDLLIKDGNHITIVDYKTNKKLDQKSFFDTSIKGNTKMKYPLNNLMDCNFLHYTLQLSTYAWMVQQLNPEFIIDRLIIVHYDHSDKVTKYDIEYKKDDVIRMLKYHKYRSMVDKELDKVKRIEY